MEIQYAIFCGEVKFPSNQQGAVILTRPISSLIVSQIKELEFPLFVTFINGSVGKHHFKAEVSNSSGTIIATRDFDFDWIRDSISQAECFLIKFPIHNSDTLTFSLYADGDKQQVIKIPVRINN